MTLERLMYTPLKEEVQVNEGSWDKQTVMFIQSNPNIVEGIIVNKAKKYGKIAGIQDKEVIFQDSILHAYEKEEYNPLKGTTLQQYVASIIEISTVRYYFPNKSIAEGNMRYLDEEIDLGDNKVTGGDIVADGKSMDELEYAGIDLQGACENLREYSYKYTGIKDIYTLIYIKLKIESLKIDEFNAECLLDATGLDKKELRKIGRNLNNETIESDLLNDLMTAILKEGVDRAFEVLATYIEDVITINGVLEDSRNRGKVVSA